MDTKRLLIGIIACFALTAGCGDDQSDCEAYCYVFCNKIHICAYSYTDSEFEQCENLCYESSQQSNFSEEECKTAKTNLSAMSCSQFLDFIEYMFAASGSAEEKAVIQKTSETEPPPPMPKPHPCFKYCQVKARKIYFCTEKNFLLLDLIEWCWDSTKTKSDEFCEKHLVETENMSCQDVYDLMLIDKRYPPNINICGPFTVFPSLTS